MSKIHSQRDPGWPAALLGPNLGSCRVTEDVSLLAHVAGALLSPASAQSKLICKEAGHLSSLGKCSVLVHFCPV